VKGKNILLWAGYHNPKFDMKDWIDKGMGGSEYCLIKLAYHLKNKGYNVTIGGDVRPGWWDGVYWNLFTKTHFDNVISINYIHFIKHLEDKNISFDNAYLWMHNEEYYNFYKGGELPEYKSYFKHPKFRKVIGVSKIHAEKLKENAKYLFNYTIDEAKQHITHIDNAIDLTDYKDIKEVDKIPGRIIWTSSSDRGLNNIIENWASWKTQRPDLSLVICSPPYAEDWFDKKVIESLKDVEWIGSQNPIDLKNEIAKSEYWVYLSDYFETYCISVLEMMMGKVKIITTGPGNIMVLIDRGSRGVLLNTPYENRVASYEAIQVMVKDIRDEKYNKILNDKVLRAHEWAQKQNWESRVDEWCKMLTN
jgi:hypothetical protein